MKKNEFLYMITESNYQNNYKIIVVLIILQKYIILKLNPLLLINNYDIIYCICSLSNGNLVISASDKIVYHSTYYLVEYSLNAIENSLIEKKKTCYHFDDNNNNLIYIIIENKE